MIMAYHPSKYHLNSHTLLILLDVFCILKPIHHLNYIQLLTIVRQNPWSKVLSQSAPNIWHCFLTIRIFWGSLENGSHLIPWSHFLAKVMIKFTISINALTYPLFNWGKRDCIRLLKCSHCSNIGNVSGNQNAFSFLMQQWNNWTDRGSGMQNNHINWVNILVHLRIGQWDLYFHRKGPCKLWINVVCNTAPSVVYHSLITALRHLTRSCSQISIST